MGGTPMLLSSHSHGTAGRSLQGCVCTTVVAGRRPSEVAVNLNAPDSWVDCTMICARPLNRLRFQFADACPFFAEAFTKVSGSWQVGSPLPTPMILPGPSIVKAI